MQMGHWFRYFFVVCCFWLLSAILDFCSFWLRFSHLWLTSYVPSLDAQLTDEVDFHPITSTPVKRGASEPAGKHSLTPSSKSAVEPRSKRHQSSVEEEEEDELGSAGNFELIFFSRQRSRHKLSCYFFITYSFPTLLFSVVHIQLVYFTNRKE